MAHVLIADDDPVFVEVVALMLESYGHVVSVAADGEEAVAGITSHTDVILVDVFMPVFALCPGANGCLWRSIDRSGARHIVW